MGHPPGRAPDVPITTVAPVLSGAIPRAVIFDLDGTLTEPLLDFDTIRAEIGLGAGLPILEALENRDAAFRARAETIMRRHELDAIAQATLADGCLELLALLGERGVPVAIMTRNMRDAVDAFIDRFGHQSGFAFRGIYTREDGPPKPSPHGARRLCQALGVAPADTVAVGDYKYDVIAARDAGCRTVLVRDPPPAAADLADWGTPDLIVGSLRALLPLWRPAR